MTPDETAKLEAYIKSLPFRWPVAMITIYPNPSRNYFFQKAPMYLVDITIEDPDTKKSMVITKNAKDLLRKINQHAKYKHLKEEHAQNKSET